MALIPVEEALAIVRDRTPRPVPEVIDWTDAGGRTLLRPVAAERDDPPFDRSSMDGYALRSEDSAEPGRFEVVDTVFAGGLPEARLSAGRASRIMTGAPVPDGADAVVPVEDCEWGDGWVAVKRPVGRGENIRYRGENAKAGSSVFEAGRKLDALDVAVGATLGVAGATVARSCRAVFLATGSELVPQGTEPGPGKIVNTNGPMLAGLWKGWGGGDCEARIVPDDEDLLQSAIRDGLRADFLVLSGGVSVGDLDLVPEFLCREGVKLHFHKVAMKPGKPILFGTKGEAVVLGLPGNPVSSFVGAVLFLRAALGRRMGAEGIRRRELPLWEAHESGASRTRFEPGRLAEDGFSVRLVKHKGSADLAAWREADALVELPAGTARFEAGTMVECLRFRHLA